MNINRIGVVGLLKCVAMLYLDAVFHNWIRKVESTSVFYKDLFDIVTIQVQVQSLKSKVERTWIDSILMYNRAQIFTVDLNNQVKFI